MKVAVTSTGPGLDSPLDQRFGRARHLLVIDLPQRTVTPIDNQAGMGAAQGAGIQAAQTLIDHKAEALITGHCGPKAFRALRAANIDVYLAGEGSVADALDRFEAGDLALSAAADVDSHW